MLATMGTIAVNDRITNAVIAAGSQTDFAVNFPALTFNGSYAGLFATRVRGGVMSTLTLSDFDVVAPDDVSFTARLRAGALAGDTYQFFGKFPMGRDIAWGGGGFSTVTAEDDMLQRVVQLQELRRDIDALQAGGGGGGGVGGVVEIGSLDWSDLTGIPSTWPGSVAWGSISGRPTAWPGTMAFSGLTALPALLAAIDGLTPAAGQIIEFTSPTAAHMIATPAGGGGGGGGGGGSEPAMLSAFGTIDGGGSATTLNDAAFTAAEAAADSAIYIPDGVYATTLAESALTKHYMGRGTILFPSTGADKLPATYSYLAAKPSVRSGTGRTGWFNGDQRFTVQEYKVVGPLVRDFDLTGQYYESDMIPRNSWMDTFSGNSGSQAFITAGVAAGATVIPLPAAADASWVGQAVAFNDSFGGAAIETHTVTAVNVSGGHNIQINAPLASTYTWNPAGGHMPGIYFAPRTWNGEKYLKMTAQGGGDHYGHNVRMVVNYVPKLTETHPFMAGTYSQYGGDVTANSDGVYLQSWESQIQGGVHDIWAISFVQSMVRNVDAVLGGRFWGGTWIQSGGTKPIDSFHTVLGAGRVALDTVFAQLTETAVLTAASNASSTFVCQSTNGAHCGDPLVIGSETLTINTVVGLTITTTAAAVGSYPIGTPVSFSKGGAALNLAKNHRILWNSSLGATARGADPLGVFSTPYGNVQGDMILESGADGGGDYLAMRFARGPNAAQPDTARMRMRPTGFQFFGTAGAGITSHSFNGDVGLTTNLNMVAGAKITMGTGVFLTFNGSDVVKTLNNGVSFTSI